jgi:hypothetical protein
MSNHDDPGVITPEAVNDHDERTVMIRTTLTRQPAFDHACPLRFEPWHACGNRDAVERIAAGQPALRPGSTCHEGAVFTLRRQVQQNAAEQAMLDLAEKTGRLLAVLRMYNLAEGDVELEVDDAEAAMLTGQMAASVAGWRLRPTISLVAS